MALTPNDFPAAVRLIEVQAREIKELKERLAAITVVMAAAREKSNRGKKS